MISFEDAARGCIAPPKKGHFNVIDKGSTMGGQDRSQEGRGRDCTDVVVVYEVVQSLGGILLPLVHLGLLQNPSSLTKNVRIADQAYRAIPSAAMPIC